jgi:hypothetical protein
MEKNNPQFITLPSRSVREFFDELSVLPLLTHCTKCETKLLHVDVTFFSSGGRVWVVPSPFCTACNRKEDTEMYT